MEILISGSYNAFSDGYQGAGVYLWSGLIPSPSFQRPIYFGSTIDMKDRHISYYVPFLILNKCHNPPLQHYYNKYGVENLVLFLVETCNPIIEECRAREQFYLDTEKPFCAQKLGFNVNLFAIGGGTNAKNYKFINPEGEIIDIFNLRGYCRSNNLDYQSMRALLSERINSYKGWIRYNDNKDYEKIEIERIKVMHDKVSKKYSLISPDGEHIVGKNIRDFCKEYEMCDSSIMAVIKKERENFRGWRIYNGPESLVPFLWDIPKYNYIIYNGVMKEFINFNKFSKENNIQLKTLYYIFKRKVDRQRIGYSKWLRPSEKQILDYKKSKLWRRNLWISHSKQVKIENLILEK